MAARKPSRLSWVLTGIVFAVALALPIVLWLRAADSRRGNAVARTLRYDVAHHPHIRVRDLADFDFDRLVVLFGGLDAAGMDHALGFHWRRADQLGQRCCMPSDVWAFVRDRKVVAYTRMDGRVGNGDCVEPGDYTPDDRLDLTGCRP